MGINDPKVGFMTPIKKKSFKSDSSDNQTAQDKALRAKQDLQAAKERESDKSRFIKQVQGAKSNTSILTPDPYAKATPGSNAIVNKIMAAKPEAPKPEAPKAPVVATTPPNPNNSKYANTRDFKGDTSLDLSNPKSKSDAGPKAKPVVKAAPKVKSQFERMQDAYEGFGKGSDSAANKAIQSRIEGKGVATKKKGGSACKGYAKGGSVKSSASSRGDGCATKGHTKGAMR